MDGGRAEDSGGRNLGFRSFEVVKKNGSVFVAGVDKGFFGKRDNFGYGFTKI